MSPAPNLPGLNALPWRRWQPVGVALLLVVLLHALVLTWLLELTGSLTVPSVYYMVISVISLVGLYFVRVRYRQA